MVAYSESYCVIHDFHKNHPEKVNNAFEYLQKYDNDDNDIVAATDQLIPMESEKDLGYQLWRKVKIDEPSEEAKIDSIKRNRWEKRTTIDLQASRFIMLPAVKTGIDDKTYMDISDVKRLYTLEMTKWMNDSMAWFIDVSWLKIPKKQEVSFDFNGTNVNIKGEGGGGTIVPIAVGFKYAIHRNVFRPYFQLGTGPLYMFIIGGKFGANSTTLDPSSIRNHLKSESRLVMHFSLGTGYEWRLGKRVYNKGDVKYLHSGRFDSAGQVNAIKGFSIGFGFGYILGINKHLTTL
jgi:hypothetical protein